MIRAKDGDTVRVQYTGRLDDGSVFDSSVEREDLAIYHWQRPGAPRG